MAASATHKWLDLFAPKEYQAYAPGIGLVQKKDMYLVSYGYRPLGAQSREEGVPLYQAPPGGSHRERRGPLPLLPLGGRQ